MSGRYSKSSARAALDLQNARVLLGKRLGALLHDQYYFNGEKDLGDIGALDWHFGDGEILSMYLLNDGQSVGADSVPSDTPAPFEIEPNVTYSWKRENLLAGSSASHLENKRICSVEGILDSSTEHDPWLAGFRVKFETGDYLIYLNRGDNAVVLINTLPPTSSGLETCFLTSL
ncbi:hypothetical protein GXB78_25840 [Pseudomonas moraviensis subsp. stanleyae]|uniref:hypothetical protein n=1 Tax=Pseudomonas moraviensis TaxID=321662 RepID=UPI002E3518CC|nr:hypothetical protein [Pseudomonas moraviensis]MED7670632.1 hypothetical protein [Pseudomonas moraviensis subsp. stanleyae]